jgi:hypothetical protein
MDKQIRQIKWIKGSNRSNGSNRSKWIRMDQNVSKQIKQIKRIKWIISRHPDLTDSRQKMENPNRAMPCNCRSSLNNFLLKYEKDQIVLKMPGLGRATRLKFQILVCCFYVFRNMFRDVSLHSKLSRRPHEATGT